MKKYWRFFVAFALGFTLKNYGFSVWETILIIAVVAIIVEFIIYLIKKCK
tara:strand:+ start:753 stop:902 length:150 start_codon:yes stop_codon:yes gene_type:complete